MKICRLFLVILPCLLLFGCASPTSQEDDDFFRDFFRIHATSFQNRYFVVAAGTGEDYAEGSYTIRVFDISKNDYDNTYHLGMFITGLLQPRDGSIVGFWVNDFAHDGKPEVIVAMRSSGSGVYGSLDIFRYTNHALQRIPVNLESSNGAGYEGHDEFTVEHGVLYRSYPVYRPGDCNAEPTGGTRKYRYDFKKSKWSACSNAR